LVKQVKGTGFSGSFKLDSGKKAKPAAAVKTGGKKKKAGAGEGAPREPLESVFPGVFTWATNPKEASVAMIRKYIGKNYPDLDVEGKAFRKAIESAESKGQLLRITGKGSSGTFSLVDGANKSGGRYEDAIENAVIAMNEPKEVSVASLRNYLGEYHTEYNTDQKPRVLKSALDRCEARGWLKQISGKGFSGSYRMMYPYYPAPRELWGKDYIEPKAKDEAPKAKDAAPKRKATKRAAAESSDEESDESEDEDSDDEVIPTPRKRGVPTPRKTAAAKKPVAKKSKVVVAKKSKPPGKKAAKGKKKAGKK